ncbi:MAG: methionine--tRNA ligase [Clostridiales bacterium]|nr:methionine--tRNA ligase [Clostridiales bacterium]
MNILIGGAWVYANGSLHIGHVAGLLPADVIARYHRLIGNKVCYVSGSDCHGTPITIRAKSENKLPSEVSEKYHQEFIEAFTYLGFSYDYYGKTSANDHKKFVEEFHRELYKTRYIYEKEEPQVFCRQCRSFLSDRFVVGKCPSCGEAAKGDQCDSCATILESKELIELRCKECGDQPTFIPTRHLYLAVTKLEGKLKELLENNTHWRKNAIAFTKRYIDEGLHDRAITRHIDWGIDVPKEGYEDKKIYIWAENVLGYLSTCYLYCREYNLIFESFWVNDAKHYYVHGKDNIPFHTIILPSLLLASGKDYNLPNNIISSEHLTLEGNKISTSKNWAIWVKDLIEKYDPDSIRYYLLAKGPEKRDADFSWREFVYSNNSELLGAYGNFVNRNLVFIKKAFDSVVPEGDIDPEIQDEIMNLFKDVGDAISEGELKTALGEIFCFIRSANKYFDEQKPWITVKEDSEKCQNTLFNCVYVICNLAVLLEPFLPFSSAKIISWFKLKRVWREQIIKAGFVVPEPEILFERLSKELILEEVEKLKASKKDEEEK